ncbi:hypothetical protein [Persephonella sp.]
MRNQEIEDKNENNKIDNNEPIIVIKYFPFYGWIIWLVFDVRNKKKKYKKN